MKRFIMAGVLVGLAISVKAEWAGNPDRKPSIGFNYFGNFEGGNQDAKWRGALYSQDSILASHTDLVLDARVPLSNNFTLNGSVGISKTVTSGPETYSLYGFKTSTSGKSFNVGMRVYIN